MIIFHPIIYLLLSIVCCTFCTMISARTSQLMHVLLIWPMFLNFASFFQFSSFIALDGPRNITPDVMKSSTGLEGEHEFLTNRYFSQAVNGSNSSVTHI